MRPVAARFWSKVDKAGPVPPHRPELGPCWVWKELKNDKGYGRFVVKAGSVKLAHRVAWELAHGREPLAFVLHSCDNRSCCNPDHLFEGTQADNIADCVAKGRLARGRRMPHAKLDEATVRAIKRSRGQSQRELAERHGVSRRLIQKIQQGLSWPQVEDSDA